MPTTTDTDPQPTLTIRTAVLERTDTVVTNANAANVHFSRFVPTDERSPFSALSIHDVVSYTTDRLINNNGVSITVKLANGESVTIDLYEVEGVTL